MHVNFHLSLFKLLQRIPITQTVKLNSRTTYILDKLHVGKHNEVIEHVMNAHICQLPTDTHTLRLCLTRPFF